MPVGLRGVARRSFSNKFSELAEAEGFAVAYIEAVETASFRRCSPSG